MRSDVVTRRGRSPFLALRYGPLLEAEESPAASPAASPASPLTSYTDPATFLHRRRQAVRFGVNHEETSRDINFEVESAGSQFLPDLNFLCSVELLEVYVCSSDMEKIHSVSLRLQILNLITMMI